MIGKYFTKHLDAFSPEIQYFAKITIPIESLNEANGVTITSMCGANIKEES